MSAPETEVRPDMRDVSGTAFVVAALREAGTLVAEPLYADPIVSLFLDDDARAGADELLRAFPPAGDMIQVRTAYFDRVLVEQIAAGARQVAILGSGFDTRPVRIAGPGVRYYEIDRPETLAYKQRVLEQGLIRPEVTYVPGDYIADGVVPLLERAGFDFAVPSFFLWEANISYLEHSQVLEVLEALRDRVAEFAISFDYMADRVIKRTTGHADLDGYLDYFARMGAPWVCGFDDIRPVAKAIGFKVLDNVTTADLYARFRPGGRLHNPLFGFYHVCTLGYR